MTTKKHSLFTAVTFLMSLLCVNTHAQNKSINTSSVTKFILRADSFPNPQIEIQNRGSKTARFSIKLNSAFYFSEPELNLQIMGMTPEFKNEPLERKAWRYVIEHVKFSKALGKENWLHSPALVINSIGNGQCDDLASVLSILWKNLGFESRVWSLSGHVVPEVFSNGKWQMYDPSHQVYYLNSKSEIASVEELSQNPDLIIKPFKRTLSPTANAISMALGHSMAVANVYATDTNNSIIGWFDQIKSVKDQTFSIPVDTKVKFPVSFSDITKTNNRKLPEYSFLSVEVPPGKETKIEVPLVIFAVVGDGKVLIDTNSFQVNSKELKNHLATFADFNYAITILENQQPVTLYYLINSRAFAFQNENLLHIIGQFDSVSATIQNDTVNYSFFSPLNIDSIINTRIANYESRKSDFDDKFSLIDTKLPLNDRILNKIHAYIDFDKEIASEDKKAKKEALSNRLLYLLKKNPPGDQKKLPDFINDPYIFIVFLTYVEFLSEEELLKMM